MAFTVSVDLESLFLGIPSRTRPHAHISAVYKSVIAGFRPGATSSFPVYPE
jgi:hypothetical protein